jgi:hypothetical protein
MKTSTIICLALLAASGNASWFGSDDKPEYESWDTQQLHHWLESNSIKAPDNYGQKDLKKLVAVNWESHKPWTEEYYNTAQKHFDNVQQSAFDTWDESRLRSWLVEQGVVEPKGPREALVAAATKRYKQYGAAASSLSSKAEAAASTAVYGHPTDQAAKSAYGAASSVSSAASVASASASSAAVEASRSAASAYATASAFTSRKMNDATDYVYSSWDDNQLRTYLENKGVIKPKQQATRDELLTRMKSTFSTTTDPAYNAWSNSYMRQWLIAHGIIKSDHDAKRDYYLEQLKTYYYTPQDKVWNTWSDSDTKAWLVKNGYIKSDAQITRDKMQNMVAKNYYNAKDTAWISWKDSDMRDWLIEHGYLRSDAQVKRDELTKLMNDKHNDAATRTADYLTWPDARLRAYLRSQGIDDTKLGGRPSLLQEVRIHYYQANNRVEQLIASIRDTINAGVGSAEAKLSQIMDMLGHKTDQANASATSAAASGTDAAKGYAHDKASSASAYGSQKTHGAKEYAAEQAADKAASAEGAARSAKEHAEDAREEL